MFNFVGKIKIIQLDQKFKRTSAEIFRKIFRIIVYKNFDAF